MALTASVIVLVLFAVHFATLFIPGPLITGEGQQDYAAFYGAAKAAVSSGIGNIYDPAVFQKAIGAETTLLWLYPPPMLMVLAPFAFVPYGVMKVILVFVTIACAFLIAQRASGSPVIGALGILSPATFAALFVGQLSAVFALLLVSGLLNASKRPILSGLCFGLLTVKPQYGLLVIPFLIATRAWKAMGAATIFSIAIALLSLLIFGVDMWRDFFDSLINGVHAAYYESGGHSGRITLSDAIKGAGLNPPPALILYAPLFIAAIAGLFAIARKASTDMTTAYVLAATAAISPYFFVYDYFIMNAAILIVATRVASLKPWQSYGLGALWFAPIVPFAGGASMTPILLWPLAALGAVIVWQAARFRAR